LVYNEIKVFAIYIRRDTLAIAKTSLKSSLSEDQAAVGIFVVPGVGIYPYVAYKAPGGIIYGINGSNTDGAGVSTMIY